MTTLTTHEVLVAAKGYLLTYGWRQGDYGDDGGPRCALGACRSAARVEYDARLDSALKLIELPYINALEEQIGGWQVSIWNDERERTFEEVIDAFDRAILAAAPKDVPVVEAVPA